MSAQASLPPLVLVVCEDRGWRDELRRALAPAGVDLAAPEDAEEALRALHARKPALIVADLHLPGGDGADFCRLLRSPAYPEFNDVPVVMFSASFQGTDAAVIARELGANDFFPAPIDGPRLVARVRSLIENPAEPAPWRILLAIDDEAEVAGLRASFAAYATRVSQVRDRAGLEASFAAEVWDTVVCDLELPGLRREHLASLVAAAPRTAFVAVTSDPSPAPSVLSIRLGVGAHIRRPFAPDYLVGVCNLAWQKVALLRAQQMLERRTLELRQSERLLQSVLDSSEQIYLVLNAAGHVEVFNEAARRICARFLSGLPARGAHLSSFLPAPLRASVEAGFARALAGEVLQHDADVPDRDGRRLRFIVRYAPLAEPGADRPRVCFNAYDITDRAEAEDELRLRNEALSSVSQGVIITCPDRRVTYVNEGFTAITGYTPEDAVGRSLSFIQGPGTDPAFTVRLRRTLEAGHAFEGEVLNYRKDGSAFWNDLTITPVKNARGEVTQYVGVQRDITERRRHLDALAASQARLQALFDHSNDAILLADDSGCCLDANPAACALLGYSRDELIGLHVSRVVGDDGRIWDDSSWRGFLEKGEVSGECSLRRRDGGLVRAEFNSIARIQPGVHLSILCDVTERHALQSRLLHQQRIESVGRLASGVAHDLNNILTPILMAPAILRPYLAEPGARMLLDSIESGARRGSFIVRQLMTFARGEAGEKVALDLRDVLRDVGSIIRETFRKDLILELAPVSVGASFPVHGDPNQLHQAVLNLALNAADAMSRGGRLILALERFEVAPADIATEPGARPGPHGLFTVVDSGAGIPPELLDKIFDPFFTTKPFGQGSGLGLSVVLGIARGHGGFVRISSRPGVGTIARLYIPFRPEAASVAPVPAAAPAPAQQAASGAGRVILLVDDEAPVREIIRGILARAGYEVHAASGADGAFSQIQASGGRLDLVLTDLAMPGVSGAKFIEMLRARRPELPVLILTGTDTRQDVPDALRATVSGVIAKPCEAAALLAAVERALRAPPAPGASSPGSAPASAPALSR